MTHAGRQPRAQSRGNNLRASGEGPASGYSRSTQPRGAAFRARMMAYANGGGVTDPLAGMSPVDLTRLRAELAAKPREMTVDERWRNYATTGADVAGSLPVIGNVMSAYDAYEGGKGAVDAAQAGDMRRAALNTAAAGLGALGAVTGLPWGRGAREAARDARSTVRSFAGSNDRKAIIDELMEKYNVNDPSRIYEMANTLPADAKRMKKLSELMEKQDSKDIDAHYGKNYYGKITDYPSSERYKSLADEYEKIAAKYGKPGTASEVDAETIIELSRNIRGDVRRLKVLNKPSQKLINAETDDPVAGFRDFYYQREGKPDVYINGIYRADEDPSTFWIEWVKGEGKNDLNKSDMQEIIKGIKERYPQVTRISGNRITGAREQAGSKRIVTLPVDKFANGGGTAARVGEYMHGGRVTVGPVAGATGGRTDALAVGVPEGAYVIPADVVAALGEGNTAAGMRQLEGQFGRPRRAHGGAVVPIRVSDGEFVVSPEHVEAVGGADVLDRFVMRQRRAYVDQLTRMAGPRQ